MDEVLYERKGAGAWLCSNRPDQLNALNPAMMSQLAHHIDRAPADNEVRALVIRGSGRAFCAGGDLTAARELAEMDPAGGQQLLIDFAAVLDSLRATATGGASLPSTRRKTG
jgi:enoyl-CoA hydratase